MATEKYARKELQRYLDNLDIWEITDYHERTIIRDIIGKSAVVKVEFLIKDRVK